MQELQARRTLVKSPPELWAEVSDPTTLARHLGEFGEIEITRTRPETIVAWEGERASGTIELEPAGWGTKVTVTAALVAAAPEPPAVVDAPPVAEDVASAVEGSPTVVAAPEPIAVEAARVRPVAAEAAPDAIAVEAARVQPVPIEAAPVEPVPVSPRVVPDPVPEPPAVKPTTPVADSSSAADAPAPSRRGFFRRLLGRRDAPDAPIADLEADLATADPPELAPADDPRPVEPLPAHEADASEPAELVGPPPDPQPEPYRFDRDPVVAPEPVAAEPELLAVESVEHEQTLAALTVVLDSLGAAHHRPFSRG